MEEQNDSGYYQAMGDAAEAEAQADMNARAESEQEVKFESLGRVDFARLFWRFMEKKTGMMPSSETWLENNLREFNKITP